MRYRYIFILFLAFLCSCEADKPEVEKPKAESSTPDNETTASTDFVDMTEDSGRIDGNSPYEYWPQYNYQNNLSNITEQQWYEYNHTIENWDFSMPPSVNQSERSQIYTDRSMAYGQKVDDVTSHSHKINASCEMWVTWMVIEPEENTYIWNDIKTKIQEIRDLGYDKVALRILTSGYKRKVNGAYKRSYGYAPLWLDNYLEQGKDDPNVDGFDFAAYNKTNWETKTDFLTWDGWDSSSGIVVCYDPETPTFHKYYLELVESFKDAGMANLVDAAYVGYGYRSHGEEYICKHGTLPDGNETVKERLDAWKSAFDGQEHKIYLGGSTTYGFEYGFGVRRGYVEKYWYTIPDLSIGQEVVTGNYLWVNEDDTYILKDRALNMEVNEEYNPNYGGYGELSTFPYRYFMSMMRVLQMRCTAVIVDGNLIPEMLPFISMQLARTIDDTPDIWSFMCQSKLDRPKFNDYDGTQQPKLSNVDIRHFERWLYQRDKAGYETTAAMPIQQPIGMTAWCPDAIDYLARKGSKIGFYADSRFGSGRKAVKVTYLDDTAGGSLKLCYSNSSGVNKDVAITLKGDGKLRTATFIVDDMKLGKAGHTDADINMNSTAANYDFTIEAADGATDVIVSMVRIVTI